MKTLSFGKRSAIVALLLALPAFAQDFTSESNLRAVLEKRLEAEVLPTCAIAGFAGEKTVLARACTEGASAPALRPDGFVEIGSISKALTGLVLADMVERGEISLDAAAASIAPKDAKLPRRDDRDIRVRDLVSQSSGLPRMPPGFSPKDMTNPYADFGVEALYESLARTELARAPGAGYEYSNFGFMWLSELLGRRAGRDFESLAKARLFEPLGMKEAAVRLSPDAAKRLAPGPSTPPSAARRSRSSRRRAAAGSAMPGPSSRGRPARCSGTTAARRASTRCSPSPLPRSVPRSSWRTVPRISTTSRSSSSTRRCRSRRSASRSRWRRRRSRNTSAATSCGRISCSP